MRARDVYFYDARWSSFVYVTSINKIETAVFL